MCLRMTSPSITPAKDSYPQAVFPTIPRGKLGQPFNGFIRWYRTFLLSVVEEAASAPLAPRNSDVSESICDLAGSLDDGEWDVECLVNLLPENDREGWQPDTINSRLNAALAGVGGESGTEGHSTSLIQARTLRA